MHVNICMLPHTIVAPWMSTSLPWAIDLISSFFPSFYFHTSFKFFLITRLKDLLRTLKSVLNRKNTKLKCVNGYKVGWLATCTILYPAIHTHIHTYEHESVIFAQKSIRAKILRKSIHPFFFFRNCRLNILFSCFRPLKVFCRMYHEYILHWQTFERFPISAQPTIFTTLLPSCLRLTYAYMVPQQQ